MGNEVGLQRIAETEAFGRPRMRLEDYKTGWWSCCDHCGCGTPDGVWPTRDGHDDTCRQGCNDPEADDLLAHVDA